MTRSETGSPLRVGVIDTDSGFLQVLVKRLDSHGWQHRISSGAVPAEDLVAMRLHALVIDLSVIRADPWEYLERVCRRLPGMPVVVCTGPSSVAQRVRGLRLGADDWVTKPCHPEELIARLEAAARRQRRGEVGAEGAPTVAGDLQIRPDHYQAFVHGISLDLTRREFELLALLSQAEGQVLPREDIYQRVWGYTMAHGDRSVDVFVRKLRQKLEKASPGWRYIHTHFGVGYRFGAEPVLEELVQEPSRALPEAAPAELGRAPGFAA